MLAGVSVSHFCRTLGVLLTNGVPIAAGMSTALTTLGNQGVRKSMAGVADEVRQGGKVAEVLAETPHFPKIASQLVEIGEETGRLEAMLGQVADLIDQDVARQTQRFIAVLTPVLTIVLGALVAVIVSSLLLAILSINDVAI